MIEIQNLTKRFGPVTALNQVSFTVPDGSIFGLIGSNGAGKSTLLRTLSGVYRPSAGQALLDGTPPYEDPQVKARLRFVADEPWLPARSTLRRLADGLSRFYKSWDEKGFQKLCAMFPVPADKPLGSLSKGQRRQASLVLALASRPDFLFLDEAFDGLDPVVRKLLKRVLAGEVADRGMTVLVASHNLRELEDLCDTIALLHKGGVVLEEELDQMRLGLHRVQAVFRKTPDLDTLRQKLCVVSAEQSGSVLSFVARGNGEEILEALDSFSPEFRELVPLSLEEVFISEMEAAGYDIENILN